MFINMMKSMMKWKKRKQQVTKSTKKQIKRLLFLHKFFNISIKEVDVNHFVMSCKRGACCSS